MGKIIDVSVWQNAIDWKKAATEVDMAILRASVGTARDKRLDANAKGCKANGVPFGVYHYLMCTTIDRAKQEADIFYNAARAYRPAFWAADVEHPPLVWADGRQLPMNPMLSAIVRAFVARLRQRAGDDAKIIYYGGESIYEPYGKLSRIPWDGLWIANYGKNNGKVSGKPRMDHDLHQYTSVGRVAGISTKVDLNRLAGDKPLSWWTGVPETVPEPVPPIDNQPAPDDPPADGDREDTGVDKDGNGRIVRATEPYAWNVRAGDGIGYDSLMVAYQGYEFEYVATAENGWLAVRLKDGRIGWISPNGAKVVAV